MNYQECLAALESLGQELRGVKFDLAAIQTILASLDNPHLRYPTAIVAGTNGKGSTSAHGSRVSGPALASGGAR